MVDKGLLKDTRSHPKIEIFGGVTVLDGEIKEQQDW